MSSAVLINDIEDSDEIFENSCTGCFRILSLTILAFSFFVGTFIGMYLLITEDINSQEITHSVPTYNNLQKLSKTSPLEFPIRTISISYTNSSKCLTTTECVQFLKKINDLKDDFENNFFVGGNGQIYEGQGWYLPRNGSSSYDKSALSIAFIDNFVKGCPTKRTINSVINFLEISQRNSKIAKCFVTSVDISSEVNSIKCLIYVAKDVQSISRKYGC